MNDGTQCKKWNWKNSYRTAEAVPYDCHAWHGCSGALTIAGHGTAKAVPYDRRPWHPLKRCPTSRAGAQAVPATAASRDHRADKKYPDSW
jgi:hypothetical protein